jgi:hypothetical protein
VQTAAESGSRQKPQRRYRKPDARDVHTFDEFKRVCEAKSANGSDRDLMQKLETLKVRVSVYTTPFEQIARPVEGYGRPLC